MNNEETNKKILETLDRTIKKVDEINKTVVEIEEILCLLSVVKNDEQFCVLCNHPLSLGEKGMEMDICWDCL